MRPGSFLVLKFKSSPASSVKVHHVHPHTVHGQDPQCTHWTFRGCKIPGDAKKCLRSCGCQRKILTKTRLRNLMQDSVTGASASGEGPLGGGAAPDPPLRPCQEACLEACAKGARVIEMACGTGKTRVIRELAAKHTGKVARWVSETIDSSKQNMNHPLF